LVLFPSSGEEEKKVLLVCWVPWPRVWKLFYTGLYVEKMEIESISVTLWLLC